MNTRNNSRVYLKFSCIYCGQHMECDPRFSGRQILCPGCLHRLVIPSIRAGVPAIPLRQNVATWDIHVPLPKIEIPTRYRNETAGASLR